MPIEKKDGGQAENAEDRDRVPGGDRPPTDGKAYGNDCEHRRREIKSVGVQLMEIESCEANRPRRRQWHAPRDGVKAEPQIGAPKSRIAEGGPASSRRCVIRES